MMAHLDSSTELDDPEIVSLAHAHGLKVVQSLWARYENDDRFFFDAEAASKACAFFPRFLRHSKGVMAGKPFELDDWQRETVRLIFGWKWKSSGLRVIRTVYLFIARKNGKSTFAAGLALLMLVGTGEKGGQVLSAAADKEQASIVFNEATSMVQASAELRAIIDPFVKALVCARLDASYRVLSADAETKHGLNPSCTIFDELHTQPTRDLYDVLHTAIGARQEPLEAYMTTAGVDRRSICYEVHSYALRVLESTVIDPAFLPIIFAADPSDPIDDPRTWAKANPSMGKAIQVAYLRDEARKAQEVPARENVFRRLHLNQWTEQSTRWLPMDKWHDCAGERSWINLEHHLRGRRCHAALDLSSRTDLTALNLIFPPDEPEGLWYVLCRFFAPENGAQRRANRDRVPYLEWAKMGALRLTEGDVIDYRVVKAQLQEDVSNYVIESVAFDPWNATMLVSELQDDGVPMVEFRQGYSSMAAPTREFEGLVVAGRFIHGDHPVLTWMAGNVAVRIDPAGNMKPDKEKSGERIDGIVACVMGVGRGIADNEGPSVYESRGFLVV
jgi:phage terminase large subunit-like protein